MTKKNILFLILYFTISIQVESIKNVSHSNVIHRLKNTLQSKQLFKNYHGTCTINVLLFLQTINLYTFEDLFIEILSTKKGLTMTRMELYLNANTNNDAKWFQFSKYSKFNKEQSINRFIDIIKNKLIEMRSYYNYSPTQELLTVLNYPSIKTNGYHAVVIWLTSSNEIIIIDPQQYYINDAIILYTSDTLKYQYQYMDDDKMLYCAPIQTYISEKIDITNEYKDSYLLTTLHYEIAHDSINKNEVEEVLNRIQMEEKIYFN